MTAVTACCLLALLLLSAGCASRGTRSGDAAPARLSQLEAGDATRRASLRLVIEGLDAESAGRGRQGTVYYERALQIDPNNPYAYLALARQELDAGHPRRSLEYLDRVERLLEEDARSPGVQAHVLGLRGGALQASGRDGSAYLAEAARLAPLVWQDGRLDARELR